MIKINNLNPYQNLNTRQTSAKNTQNTADVTSHNPAKQVTFGNNNRIDFDVFSNLTELMRHYNVDSVNNIPVRTEKSPIVRLKVKKGLFGREEYTFTHTKRAPNPYIQTTDTITVKKGLLGKHFEVKSAFRQEIHGNNVFNMGELSKEAAAYIVNTHLDGLAESFATKWLALFKHSNHKLSEILSKFKK